MRWLKVVAVAVAVVIVFFVIEAGTRPLPDGVTDLDQFRVQRRDRAGA